MTTDPRPNQNRFTMPVHHQSPPGTDGPSHEDADALDAWLNARANAHEGVSATPASHDPGNNGQVASARQFHARFTAAEEAGAPETPVDAIWEQVMGNTLIAPAQIPPPVPITARSQERRPTRHPMLVAVGSHPAATALMVTGVILAIILVFRTFAHDPNAPIIDYGPAAMIPGATATASPASADIWLHPITGASCAAPFNSSNPSEQAAHLLRQFLSCDSAQRLPMMSDDLVARHPEMRNGQYTLSADDITRAKAIAPVVAETNPQLTIVDPGVAANWFPGVFLPQNAIQLEDGRFAIPITVATSDATPTQNAAAMASDQAVILYVVVIQDGQPRLDDTLVTCINNCDAFWARQQLRVGTPEPGNDVVAAQAATAEAKQADSDIWLQPITTAECDTPITTGTTYQEQAALLLRSSYACYERNPDAQDPESFYSSDFLMRHPEAANGQYTLSAADVANAQAISTVVAAANPQIIVTGLPGADDDSNRTNGFYEVFLPDQNSIGLSGGFAIPISIAFPDEARTQQAATVVATSRNPVTVALYVFTLQDGGTPRVDDILLTCIANCDGFWEQQRAKIGTPEPSNEQVATQRAALTATAAAKQPIPSSECTMPTVVGEESLPERSYSPLLKPTDTNATEVSQDARAFIACIEASPTPGANTPPAKIQDVVAPFETERRRAEDAATDPSQPIQPTDDQIAAGKRISAYLAEQGVTSFAERAPEGVLDPGDSTWPGTLVHGQMADTTPGWYTVPMPGVVVQLGDGRIGIPIMQMITNDDLWALHQEQSATNSGGLWVFAKVGDQWLLDEGIALCIGDCDAYWQQLATPLPPSESLQPIQASECVPISASTYRDYVRPRDYMVVNTAAQQGVAQQSRAYTACMGWGTVTPQAPASDFQTARHETEDTRRLSTAQIAGAKELSMAYTDAGFSPYQRAPEGVDFRDAHTMTTQRADEGPIVYTPIFDPNTAIGLSDGRVAIPTTYLIADDRSWNQAQGQPLPVTTTLTIWANVNGTWLIDEELPLCIGDCDSLWSYLESRAPGTTPPTSSPAPGTPASPPTSAVLPIDRRALTV